MSGNYDYPPASSRRPSRAREIHIAEPSTLITGPHGQALNDIHETHDRLLRQTQLFESLNTQREPSTSNPVEPDLETILSEIRFGANSTQASRGTPRDSPRSPPRIRDRLRYLRSLIHSESNRSNPEDTLRALETLNQEIEDHHIDQARNLNTFEQVRATVDHQIQQLQSDPNRRAFFEAYRPFFASETSPPRQPSNRTSRRRSFRPDLRESLPTPSLMPQPSQTGRARLKRRKLESDDNREGMRGFNYGHHGQVVPGVLKMEIASCDGGIYDPDGECSFPDNVLRNDQSVYCTKSDRCNLVLRHRGEAPFCLNKIVIRAPEIGFDSPIQEGMVFVSMTSDELLARTAQYQIQYSGARRRHRNRRSTLHPSSEYLGLRSRSPLPPLGRTVLMGPDSHSMPDMEAVGQGAHDPQSEFRVTTEYEERSDDNIFERREDDRVPPTAEVERVREEDLNCSDSEDDSLVDDDDEEDDDDTPPADSFARRLNAQRRTESLGRQRQGPSLVDPIPPSGSHGNASRTEVLKPHARFFIEREKSMVSIKFHPPPSGRFILIKLWSPRSDGNIDIQSIIAHGYAGPRFFPTAGFR